MDSLYAYCILMVCTVVRMDSKEKVSSTDESLVLRQRIVAHDWMDWMVRKIVFCNKATTIHSFQTRLMFIKSSRETMKTEEFMDSWQLFMKYFPKNSVTYQQCRKFLNLLDE